MQLRQQWHQHGDMAETDMMRKRARDERADGCKEDHDEPGRAASPGGARQGVALAVSERQHKNSRRLPCAREGARAPCIGRPGQAGARRGCAASADAWWVF